MTRIPDAAMSHFGPGAASTEAPPDGALVIVEHVNGGFAMATFVAPDRYVEPWVCEHLDWEIKRWWLAPGQDEEKVNEER